MVYQPPFTITTDILNLVAQISQQVGELNASQLNASVNAPLKEGRNAPVNTLINVTGLKTPEAILALLSNTPELTRQQLADTLNKDVRTIGRAISKLQKEGRLTRVGSDKTGHWQVTE